MFHTFASMRDSVAVQSVTIFISAIFRLRIEIPVNIVDDYIGDTGICVHIGHRHSIVYALTS